MVFENSEHKKIIKELGYNPDTDYQSDSDETSDLFLAVTDRVQRQGFIYEDGEPILTRDGILCEEIADILSDL